MRGKRHEDRAKVRRQLWRWGHVNENCLRLQRDLDEKKAALQAVVDIKSPIMSDMPHGSGISDRTARAAEKLEELERIYEDCIEYATKKIAEEMRFQRAIDEIVASLPGSQRWVLELRYKSDCSYERIAGKTNYTVEHVKRIEGKACDRLANMIDVKVATK